MNSIWKYRKDILQRINIIKTIYLNFSLLPFREGLKFPIFVYGKLKTSEITGKLQIRGPIKRNMLRLGSKHEMNITHANIAQLTLKGHLIIHGFTHIGIDTCLYIGKDACLEIGEDCYIGMKSQIYCLDNIKIGKQALIGSETYITDSDFHHIKDNITKENLTLTKPIIIGEKNYLGFRVVVLKGCITPNNCIFCSCAVGNKNYLSLGENIMIGGIPAKLIKENIGVSYSYQEQ
ncbi:MAG: hypothetical protein RR319_03670 [Bacteroides sp.]